MLFIALIVLFGCSPGVKRMDKPENLIGKDKMVVILTELMKLEGHVESKYVQLPRYYKVIDKSGDSIIRAHGCTPEQFSKSYDYYSFEQDDLQNLYAKVLERLNREMTEIELEEQNNPSKPDTTTILEPADD